MTCGPHHFPAFGRSSPTEDSQGRFWSGWEGLPSQRLFIAHPRGICGFKPRNQPHLTLIRPLPAKLDMPSRHLLPFHALSLTLS